MINKKGYLLFELILGIALVLVVSIIILNTIISLNNITSKQMKNNYKNEQLSLISNEIGYRFATMNISAYNNTTGSIDFIRTYYQGGDDNNTTEEVEENFLIKILDKELIINNKVYEKNNDFEYSSVEISEKSNIIKLTINYKFMGKDDNISFYYANEYPSGGSV